MLSEQEKTAEPWILHEFGRDFHGEEIRLLVCAYIRPEANFPSLQVRASVCARAQGAGSACVWVGVRACVCAVVACCSLQTLAPRPARRAVPRCASPLQALVDRIHQDADATREALDQLPYSPLKDDPFLQPQPPAAGAACPEGAPAAEPA